MIIYRYREGDLCIVLTDNVFVKHLLDLRGLGESIKRKITHSALGNRVLINELLTRIHTKIADIRAGRRGNKEIHLIFSSAAE